MATKDFEYFIRRVVHKPGSKNEGLNQFEVAKFNSMVGGEQPQRVYTVTISKLNQGKCDCPAGMYRGTGDSDKHVRMVRSWLAANEPQTAQEEPK